jgi:hypothetical protein
LHFPDSQIRQWALTEEWQNVSPQMRFR